MTSTLRLSRQSVYALGDGVPRVAGLKGGRSECWIGTQRVGTMAIPAPSGATAGAWCAAGSAVLGADRVRLVLDDGNQMDVLWTASGAPAVAVAPRGLWAAWSTGAGILAARHMYSYVVTENVAADPTAEFPALASSGSDAWCAWRVQDKAGRYRIHVARRSDAGWVEWPGSIAGMDPSLAVCGGYLWLGYHNGWTCYLRRLPLDGVRWTSDSKPITLDTSGHFVGLAADPARSALAVSWSRWSQVGDDKRDDLRTVGAARVWIGETGSAKVQPASVQCLGGYQLYPGPYAEGGNLGVVWVDASRGDGGRVEWAGI